MKLHTYLSNLVLFTCFSCLVSCFRSPTAQPPPDPTQEQFLQLFSISNNHGHVETTIKEDNVILGVGGTYDLIGGDHKHQFVTTDLEMRNLRNGQRVNVTTHLSQNHFHTFSMEYHPSDK